MCVNVIDLRVKRVIPWGLNWKDSSLYALCDFCVNGIVNPYNFEEEIVDW
jgi:hypothetical protein